jgi:flagellar basal-body rod protein FlgB
MIESPLLNFIENRLDVSAKRQQLISGNIANVDTPGYLAQDVTFDQQLDILD